MATQEAAASAKHWRRRERGVTAALLSAPMLWLLLFFVAPVVYVASYSLGAIKLFPTDTGVISLDGWRHFFGGGSIYLGLFWKSVRMSLTVSVIVVLLAYPIGYFLALCVRKLKYVLLLVVIVPFLTSFLLRVLAWKVMLGDKGVVNSLLVSLHVRPANEPIEWLLYSQFTVMLVLAYVWIPFVALPIFVSLDNLDRSLLEAASDLGASRVRTFLRVTLPLSLPGLIAAFVFVFVPTIGEFVTPLLVGGTNGYMYGNAIQDLFTRTTDWQTRLGPGDVPAAGRGRPDGAVRTVRAGPIRGGRLMEIATSRGGRISLTVFFWLLVIFLYLPIMVLAVFSFNDGDPSFPLSGFTTHWYGDVLSNRILVTALGRSVVVATISSLIAVTLGVLTSFALLRRRFRGKPVVSALVFSPLVIPYLVFGISLLLLFTLLDKVLSASFGFYFGLGLHSVVIGHVVVALPYTILTVMPLLERLSVSLDEAAKDLGASPRQTFRRVTLPLLRPALISAFLVAFTLSFDEFAIASFLAGTQQTWPVYLFAQLRVPSLLPQLIAVSSVVFIASMLLVLSAEIGRRLAERRFGREYTARGLV